MAHKQLKSDHGDQIRYRYHSLDLAKDGKRIAALMPVETPEAQQTQNQVIFLPNFGDGLQRKVRAGK